MTTVARGFGLAVLTVTAGACVLNALIALAAQALGADSAAVPGLTPPAYLTLTLVGVVLGAAGWTIVRRFAEDPATVLSWLVPLVVVVSLIPDVLIALRLDAAGGIALGLMHFAVLAVALPTFRRLLPLPEARRPIR
ncbi:hypothetical protein SAMN05216553_108323 [Lentzea fradiae]|uniref:PEP-CTERM protein-sorting domain-containing protein n=1 Tax=Lentzea fradiae TaxID=200378 RepID=A0A1G7UNW8_9PSEU|nr:DUF6069 family protein [Lentzea fradiae]SDG49206.1 hypothetical protein SAMN05216553_108323 [Lentzea fradiae]